MAMDLTDEVQEFEFGNEKLKALVVVVVVHWECKVVGIEFYFERAEHCGDTSVAWDPDDLWVLEILDIEVALVTQIALEEDGWVVAEDTRWLVWEHFLHDFQYEYVLAPITIIMTSFISKCDLNTTITVIQFGFWFDNRS